MGDSLGIDETRIDAQMSLAQEWTGLVEQARRLDGLQDFLRPSPIERLLPAAAGGPVVVVNVSAWRCDALMVTEDGVASCELPGLTLDGATAWTVEYLDKLQAVDSAAEELAAARAEPSQTYAAVAGQYQASQKLRDAETVANQTLRELQARLWDAVAAPVLDALGLHEQPSEGAVWPRLWWCPTGPLTLLPLHSAQRRDGAAGQAVMDRVVSSYTPTLRALIEARRPRKQPTSPADLLIVSADEQDGQREERELLESLVDRSTVLAGPAATRAAVSRELESHRWVHFGCHGDQNVNDPSNAGLVLADGLLTVLDLSANSHDGDFAGLSACKTAVGGVDLLDEAITLAAALHYTGYRHVVASLWSIRDRVAAEVFGNLYDELMDDGSLDPGPSAVALHRAVRRLREMNPDLPWLWAAFVHMGP